MKIHHRQNDIMKLISAFLVLPLLLSLVRAEPFLIDPADFDFGEIITNDFATLSVVPASFTVIIEPLDDEPPVDPEYEVISLAGLDEGTPVIGARAFFPDFEPEEMNVWFSDITFRVDFVQDMFSVDVFTSGEGGMRIFNREGDEIGTVGEFGEFPPFFIPQDVSMDPPVGSGSETLSYFSPEGNIAAVEVSFTVADGPGGEIYGVGFSAIPEPSTMGLLQMSLFGLMTLRRLK